MPFAFTEQGVAMLSSVLNSDIAIQVNINIMRAFVAVRQMLANPPVDRLGNIEKEVKELKEYIEEVFADYNDINDDTRMQLELINQTLAELQAQRGWRISHVIQSVLLSLRRNKRAPVHGLLTCAGFFISYLRCY